MRGFFLTSIMTSILTTMIYCTNLIYFIYFMALSLHTFTSCLDIGQGGPETCLAVQVERNISRDPIHIVHIVHIVFDICGPINWLTKAVHTCIPYRAEHIDVY